jgi:hypothetical protein
MQLQTMHAVIEEMIEKLISSKPETVTYIITEDMI